MRLWVLAVLIVPMAGASQAETGIWNPWEPTPVDLWLHCHGAQDCAVNTQVPDAEYQDRTPLQVPTRHSQGCQDIERAGIASGRYHTFYAFSSPGPVEYDPDGIERPQVHPESGLGYDVALDLATQPIMHFYLKVAATRGEDAPHSVPLVAPLVRVSHAWRTQDEVTVAHEVLETGEVIAHATSDAVTLSPMVEHPQVSHHSVDGAHIYGFHLPLQYTGREVITAAESFHIRTDVSTDIPCGEVEDGEYVMAGTVDRYAGGELWPRLEASILNPLRIEYIVPQFVGTDLVFHASANSPWGSYDLADMQLHVSGPSQPRDLKLASYVQRSHDWYRHQDPVDATWVWAHEAERAKPGAYQAVLSATNLQGTATARAATTFVLGSEPSAVECRAHTEPVCFRTAADAPFEAAPGPWLPLVAVALVAAGLMGRRNKA